MQGPASAAQPGTRSSERRARATTTSLRAADRPRTAGDGFSRRAALNDTPLTDAIVQRAVERGKRGDQEALRFLYDRYADNVYGYVCSIVHDEHEAEDITQNVFMKLMRVLPKYERRSVPFSAWLLRIARNMAVDSLRNRRAIVCETVRDPDVAADDGAADRAISLGDALEQLSLDQRRVMLLQDVVGLAPGEIAERLGKTTGSVHALHHRGRRVMRRELSLRQAAPSTQR
jgi:RNA polymerase sigma-70 factor, ECF subfamily